MNTLSNIIRRDRRHFRFDSMDMGSGPCTMVVCLADKIGDGRVFAVDLCTGSMDTPKNTQT